MPLCPNKLKHLRTEHGWSQEHLADVAGLSLRTIQRVEMDGKCSPETHMALASAFQCVPKDLIADEQLDQSGRTHTDWGALAGLVLAGGLITGAVTLSVELRLFFNMPAFFLVIGLILALTLMTDGTERTWNAIKNIGLLIRTSVGGDFQTAPVLNRMASHCYVAGSMAMGIAVLQMLFNGAFSPRVSQEEVAHLILPLFYGHILAEFVVRPIKMRLES